MVYLDNKFLEISSTLYSRTLPADSWSAMSASIAQGGLRVSSSLYRRAGLLSVQVRARPRTTYLGLVGRHLIKARGALVEFRLKPNKSYRLYSIPSLVSTPLRFTYSPSDRVSIAKAFLEIPECTGPKPMAQRLLRGALRGEEHALHVDTIIGRGTGAPSALRRPSCEGP
jgi:hypothetical protein